MTRLEDLKPGARFAHPTTGEPHKLVKLLSGAAVVQPLKGKKNRIKGREFDSSPGRVAWSRRTEVEAR